MSALTVKTDGTPKTPAEIRLGRASGLLIPEKLSVERWIAFGVFGVTLLYLGLFRKFTVMDPDEGIILQGAQRILAGQILYRDFFSYFTPGSYYFLAMLFKAFGSSLLVARTALVVYGAFFSLFAYLLARRVVERRPALAVAYLVTLTCVPWRFMTVHNWDSTVWACATVYCAVRFFEAPRRAWAFAAGSFASVTVLFEQSKGAGLLLGLGLGGLLVAGFVERQPAPQPVSAVRNAAFQFRSPKIWVALLMGLAWPLALALGYFGMHHALPVMFTDWFWPVHNYSAVNCVPYGYQDWSDEARRQLFGSKSWLANGLVLFTVSPCFVLPVLPIVAIILLIYWLVETKRGWLSGERAAYYVLVCSSIAGLLVSVLISRDDIIHFVHLAPLLYLVLAWLMDGKDIRGRIVDSLRPYVVAWVLATFSALGMAFLTRTGGGKAVITTRRGVLVSSSSDGVVKYLVKYVPAGSTILVHPYMPMYYYLTETVNPTAYDYLQPGMHSARQEQEFIRQLSADRTAVVIFQPSFYDEIGTSWPKTSLTAIASDPVADYILAHYRLCQTLASASNWEWRFVAMVRQDLSCPGTPHRDGGGVAGRAAPH